MSDYDYSKVRKILEDALAEQKKNGAPAVTFGDAKTFIHYVEKEICAQNADPSVYAPKAYALVKEIVGEFPRSCIGISQRVDILATADLETLKDFSALSKEERKECYDYMKWVQAYQEPARPYNYEYNLARAQKDYKARHGVTEPTCLKPYLAYSEKVNKGYYL